MGNGNSAPAPEPTPEAATVQKVKERPKRITETQSDELLIPELEEKVEGPRLILLTALLRIARAADPNYDVKDLYKYFKIHEKSVQLKKLTKGEIIFRKGETPDGVYVVLDGELSAFEGGKRDEVLRIFKKDFAFDVECAYELTSLYTIRALTDCTVNVVTKELLAELLKDLQRPHIQYWYIRRRLPPNHPKLTPKVVYNKICISVMQQIPLFSQWQESTIQEFIDYMGKTPMLLYRPRGVIIKQGEEGGDMKIIVRGRAHAYDRKNKLVTFYIQKIPFAFGEEGIFNEGWNHKITLVADSPCYVITINKYWVWHASEFVWEFAEGAEPHWTEAVTKWCSVLKSRQVDLTENSIFSPYLTVEIIYQWLRGTKSFEDCAMRYVYELAKCGTAMVMEKNGFFDFADLEKGCLLVLKGQLELLDTEEMNTGKPKKKKKVKEEPITPNVKTLKVKTKPKQPGVDGEEEEEEEEEEEQPTLFNAQDLIYYKSTEEKSYLKANTECLLIKFPLEDIMNEMQRVRVDKQPVDFLKGVQDETAKGEERNEKPKD